jgi:hypothetical protein
MFGRASAAVLSVTILVLSACATAKPAADGATPGPTVTLDHGVVLPANNTTTKSTTIPATALFSSGPYDLSAKLRAYGIPNFSDETPVWIDGTRHYGIEALAGLTLDDIVQVDVVRGVWGGLTGSGAISITTKRAKAAAK